MNLSLSDSRKIFKFATLFANLKPFSSSVVVHFRSDGLYIQSMDDSHCSLLECSLQAAWFDDYVLHNDTTCRAGISLSMFHKVLHSRQDNQKLVLSLLPQTDTITIAFLSVDPATRSFDKQFELPLMDIEVDLVEIKENTEVDVILESKLFTDLINQLNLFDDNLTLVFQEEQIELISKGMEGSMKAVIKIENVKSYVIPEGPPLTQAYSLKYLQMMCQFNKLANDITMGFGNFMPMSMRYNFTEDGHNFIRIHLAPKMNPDAEDEPSSSSVDVDNDEF